MLLTLGQGRGARRYRDAASVHAAIRRMDHEAGVWYCGGGFFTACDSRSKRFARFEREHENLLVGLYRKTVTMTQLAEDMAVVVHSVREAA